MIPFNKPFIIGKEVEYIRLAVKRGKISGNGFYTQKVHRLFEKRYGFRKCLLTTSCTDALEMASILADIRPGDEVIMPSFTFVSTATAFVLRGAKIVFADSGSSHPNIDADAIESLITPRTKALVVVHYAGVACQMDTIMSIARKHNLYVIEDAAQAVDSYYKGIPLGSIGHFAAFSFHETKNIQCGEGGMLVIHKDADVKRAEVVWEKGTNRAAFWRGEVSNYEWVDIGSSFLPSEVTAAFLCAQVEKISQIQKKRQQLWRLYYQCLKPLEGKGLIQLPYIPDYATNNAHLFYIMCGNLKERTSLLRYMNTQGVGAVFHYLSLHKSAYYKSKHDGRPLPLSDKYADSIIRLPLYYMLSEKEVEKICRLIYKYF